MKLHLIVIASLTMTGTAAADDADQLMNNLGSQIGQAWYRDSETKAWLLADAATDGLAPAPCTKILMQLRNLGVPGSRTIELLDDSRDLRRGVHALPAVRAACDRIEYFGKVKAFEHWARLAAETSGPDAIPMYEHCVTTYDAIVKAGVKPTEQVPQRRVRLGHDLEMWSGTIEGLRAKYCDGGLAKARAELDQRTAPLRAVLRADKRAMALGFNGTAAYALSGGDWSMQPGKLAAASVWFDSTSAPSNERQTCDDGRRRTLIRRYVFDKQHRLVKTTTREYCGAPPAAAFR